MLTRPALPTPPRRPLGLSLPLRPLLACCLLLAGGSLPVAAVEFPNAENAPSRPADLLVLQQRSGPEGPSLLGVFGAVSDPVLPGLWRVKLWQERIGRVTVSGDVVRCDPAAPMRISGEGRQQILRELNPGGLITPANRLDHLVWWAVCVPRQAGVDPALLGPEARRLGYSGRLQERLQILP
jgi:hypothetical protein